MEKYHQVDKVEKNLVEIGIQDGDRWKQVCVVVKTEEKEIQSFYHRWF